MMIYIDILYIYILHINTGSASRNIRSSVNDDHGASTDVLDYNRRLVNIFIFDIFVARSPWPGEVIRGFFMW
jgi:hypothetical protein